ncbi:NAD-binding protein, partial [Xenorhabdus bovienii]|uniref:NAD-binding protein n=1 Tax=Xenorhabdus bovienii TaxID=40576 RepID=UPI0023B32B30
MFSHSRRTALTISVSLAQIGEFAFILAGLGVALGLLDGEARNLVLAGAMISIMLNPILFSLLDRYLEKTETIEEQLLEETLEEATQIPVNICGHAIVVGYGRVGHLLCQRLQDRNFPVVVIEDTRARFEELGEMGISTVMGNAANKDTMALARLDCACTLFLTIPNGYEAGEIVANAREIRPDINIIVRAHYDDEVTYITERGTNQIVIGEHEIARAMADAMPGNYEASCPIDPPQLVSPIAPSSTA